MSIEGAVIFSKIRHPMDISLKSNGLSIGKLRALVSPKVKLGLTMLKHGHNMALI